VQHAEQVASPFPWRAASVVLGAIAAAELAALLALGAVHLAPQRRHASAARSGDTAQAAGRRAKPARRVPRPPSHALRPRGRVSVLVLNGNGVQGAAALTASRLRIAGYRVGGAANAQRHDYSRSMVMYVPGWVKEARRLARDEGVRLVAPVDGLTPARLRGSTLVLLLGR
jgi:LytR cell envelope-related transcriptional attenuator